MCRGGARRVDPVFAGHSVADSGGRKTGPSILYKLVVRDHRAVVGRFPFVGSVVLLFSILLPIAKILLLLELSFLNLLHRRHKAVTYRVMELVGKWSMMDVMLLAFLVMLVKLGNLVGSILGRRSSRLLFVWALIWQLRCFLTRGSFGQAVPIKPEP